MNGVEIKESAKALKALMDTFRYAEETEVVVGVPQEANAAHTGGITNAELLYIHENGSPVNRIPPRPVLKLGINDPAENKTISQAMGEGLKAALRGDIPTAEKHYKTAGMAGMNAVQSKFGSAELAANFQIPEERLVEVNGRMGMWMRNRVSGKPVFIEKKNSSAPLIDTGSLRKSITYAVRKKR